MDQQVDMSDKSVTIKEIAEECGVSLMTVSRALDPRQHTSMRPETRQRIMEIVQKRGYVSNLAARRLKRQKADAVTLIMAPRTMIGPKGAPDFDAHHESISWGLVRGVIGEARKWNYDVELESLLNYGLTADVINHLKPEYTDGVIFNGRSELEPIIDFVRRKKIPFIILGDSVDFGSKTEYPEIYIDRRSGVRDAVEALWNSGHRKIGYLGCEKLVSSNFTLALLRDLLLERSGFDEKLMYSVANFFELRTWLTGFKGNFPFTALLCLNDTAADMAVRELRFMGIKVPTQVAIIGLDGNPVYAGPGKTNLSTICNPFEELSGQATRIIIEIIEKKRVATEGFPIVIPTTFRQGETT